MSDLGGIRLVLDQGVPRDAAEILRDAGFDCVHVGELGLSQAADLEIIELTRQRGAIVVTLDADFHMILAVTSASTPSAIRIRIQGLGGSKVAGIVRTLIGRFSEELRQGCLITVKPNRTTCHVLPVAGIG